jgi:hypothetical protein
MPCLCVKCHEPCNCDELLCARCLCAVLDDDITAHELYEKENEMLKEREKGASALDNE